MPRKRRPTVTDLEQKFDETAFRLIQERNDFLLPQVVDFVQSRKWLNIRPEYQRRIVWDVAKRSRFIESLLLNIPVPPVFLYERDLGRYEVMDGQQRLTAIVDFYGNQFALQGLEQWHELTGYRYKDLPETLQRGLNRRRLSATVLLLDRPSTSERQHSDIRALVFDRLNTGGQPLNSQELRHSLFHSPFSKLLMELSQQPAFRRAWDIHDPVEGQRLYRRMLDCEIVLRFFALRHPRAIRGSLRSMLDRCMAEHMETPDDELVLMGEEFRGRLTVAIRLFGKQTFRYPDHKGKPRLSPSLYDAVMVSIDHLWSMRKEFVARKKQIQQTLATLLKQEHAHKVIVGNPNTAKAIRSRIRLLESVLTEI